MRTTTKTVIVSALLFVPSAFGQQRSGRFFVTQSWSQETDFRRPYFVRVPEHTPRQRLPVLIFLHGNGGEAERAMNGFQRRHREIASQYVTVFPNGYARSWNIVSERSKADDTAFIESIIKQLATQPNIRSDNFSILGVSNGAALVNQLAIESKLPNIRNLISSVSPLNSFQHDGKNFKARGNDNNYRDVAEPVTGRRLMNISGTEDHLVPYNGGLSRAIPAKNGKLSFVSAEQSTFLWAKHMGYKGQPLARPTQTDGKLQIFSYLGGDVVHYKVNGEGHGAAGAVSEPTLLAFLNGAREREDQPGEIRRQSFEQKMAPLRARLAELVRENKLTPTEADSMFKTVYPSAPRVPKRRKDTSKQKTVFDIYQARSIEGSRGGTLHYRLFVPPDYDSKRKYPLVLFHHGGGGAGDDNRRNLEGACVREWISAKVQTDHPCFIVAPQIPGKKARDTRRGESPGQQMRRRIETVHEILDGLENEFSIDTSREYVTGLSFGGECTWLSLLARPERFAAAVPICAGDRLMDIPNTERGTRFAKLPLWIFHGDADRVIPVDVSRRIVKALRDAGGTPKYTEYPGVGHYSWDRAYRDPRLIDWLFSQSR